MELPKRSEKAAEKDLFESLGIEVAFGDVKVGGTYPIFGMITKILSDEPGQVVAEINYNIRARMNIPDATRIELLKQRAFESGIFVSTITAKDPEIEVDCQTVIFGRSQAFNA